MTGDVELTKSTTTGSLHHRNSGGRIYETRTPDGLPVGDAGARGAKHDELQTTLFNWEGENGDPSKPDRDVKGKGRAITHEEKTREDNAHSAASSEDDASDEDDELLPSFGGQDDFDRPVYSNNDSNSRKSNASNSRASLGMNQNGFISRDDMLDREGDRNGNHDSNNDNDEKPYKESSSSNTGKPKKKRRKAEDRHNPRRFAREMAFVVSFTQVYGKCIHTCLIHAD